MMPIDDDEWADVWALACSLFRDCKTLSREEQAVYRTVLSKYEVPLIKAGLFGARRHGKYLTSPDKVEGDIKRSIRMKVKRSVETKEEDKTLGATYRTSLLHVRPEMSGQLGPMSDHEVEGHFRQFEYDESVRRHGAEYLPTQKRLKRLNQFLFPPELPEPVK